MAPTAPRVTEDTSKNAWFPWQQHHKIELPETCAGNQASNLPLLERFILLSWQQNQRTVHPAACAGSGAPELPLSTGFALPSKQQSDRTTPSEAYVGNQAPKLLLFTGFVFLHLPQLPWLLEAQAPMQVDQQGFCCLVDNRQFKPLALLPYGYPQEPGTTQPSEPQAPGLAILLARGGFPPNRAWKPSTLHFP
jgi:hypothetical protein